MDLTAAAKLIRNHLSVQQTEEGIVPLRFTERQLGVYARQDNYRVRSLCPAGIRIDVVTDSDYVRFHYEIKDACRKWAYFNVFVDEIWVTDIGEEGLETRKAQFHFDIPSQPADSAGNGRRPARRVTIDLPHSAEIVLHSFELSDGASVAPAPEPERRLLAFGDSITQGMDARHPASTYPALIARQLGMGLLNQGVGGYVFEADSLDPALAAMYKPDLITIAYGTNDWGRYETLQQFRLKCADYLAGVASLFEGVPIVVMTPLWRKDRTEPKKLGAFDLIGQTIAELAAAYPAMRVLDGARLIPHLPRLFGDGLHPTDEGFAHIAMNVIHQAELDK